MDWHIYPNGRAWRLRKTGSGRSVAEFRLRREAITEAKTQAEKTKGVVYVHDSSGFVTIRIPELQRVAASVHIYDAPNMTKKLRSEVAAWLRQHAKLLVSEGGNYSKQFRGRCFTTTP